MKIALFIPTMWSIETSMVSFLMKLKTKHDIQLITTTKTLIHSARNLALDEMIKMWADYLIMIDSDNYPEYNDFIDVMIDSNKDILSWVIRLRNRQEDLNICKIQKTDWPDKYINYQNIDWLETIQEIWNCWSWLVCLSRKVCEEMTAKYPRPFENKMTYYIKKSTWEYIEFSPHIFQEADFETTENWWLIIKYRELSEDYLFFERARSLGYKLYAHTKLTCLHLQDQKPLYV